MCAMCMHVCMYNARIDVRCSRYATETYSCMYVGQYVRAERQTECGLQLDIFRPSATTGSNKDAH